jgi:hypothetical protein
MHIHFVYLSSLNKTLRTPTCFGLIDHPQGYAQYLASY